MAVTYPNAFPKLNDEEYSVERPASVQSARKLVQAVNMLSQLVIPGQIKAFQVNQQGVPPLSAIQFMYCDGTEITDPTSPLSTVGSDHRFTPDMRGQYVRGGDTSITSGTEVGGNATIDMSHTHTTGNVQPPRDSDGEEGDEQASGVDHTHGINSDLSAAEPLELAHLKVSWYLKIN